MKKLYLTFVTGSGW